MNKKNTAVTIILLTMIVLLVVSEIDWLNKNSNALIVIMTAIYALLTYFILRSNNKLLEETTRPYVVVSLPVKELKIYLSIKNVGKRPACDVQVEIEPALHTIGKGFYDETWSKPLMKQLLIPPEHELSNLIGTTYEVINSNTVMPTIKIKISYADLRKEKFSEEYSIDLSSYIFRERIVDYNERHYLELISKHLENIHKDISKNG